MVGSYGVMTELFCFLPRQVRLELQLVNKFWYTVVISRIETRFQLPLPVYLYSRGDYQTDLVEYRASTRAASIFKNFIPGLERDPDYWKAVQIGIDLLEVDTFN